MDWLDMVMQCRTNADYNHGYDIVIGKIANDKVGETVSYVVQGVMRREDALDRFCKSATGRSFSDDETGLYGMSALYSYGLFVEETETG